MDGHLELALLEAGKARIVTERDATTDTYHSVLDRSEFLSDASQRFQAAERLLQSWRERLPRLAIPGVSLCQRCEDIDVELLKSSDGYMHSEDFWRLSASAGECPMCALIAGALRGAYPNGDFNAVMKLYPPMRTYLRILLPASNEKKKEEDGSDDIKFVSVEIGNGTVVLHRGRLCVFALPGSPAAKYGLQQRFAPEANEKFSIMLQWLSFSPLSMIRIFLQPAIPQEYPRRLIDVGNDLDNPSEVVYLVEKSAMPSQRVQYASLSYRWGSRNSLKTTKETIRDHQMGISLNKLPGTLRDAVAVARRLWMRYLWIDALCIIQDDVADWTTEAAHMGDIYMNSAFTIAAHAAEHADDGFLNQALARPRAVPVGGHRNGGSYGSETAAYAAALQQEKHPDGNLTHDGSRESVEISGSDAFFVTESFHRRGHLDNSELGTRGWALQERVLSLRTIHFCRNGSIYFETETSLWHIDDRLGTHASANSEYQGMREALSTAYNECRQQGIIVAGGGYNTSPKSPSELLAKVRRDWYDLVARYSTCGLTKRRDRLVAISGIARKLQHVLDDKYYCGIWERHFYTNLLWLRRKGQLTPQTFSATARAASWSWGAHDGEIQFPIWSSGGSDAVVKPEISFGMVLNRELPPSKDSLFDGWGMLELREAVRIGTGLRFLHPRTGKPQWQQNANVVTMSYQTRFWVVASDAGEDIGWAALDWDERDEIDGDVDRITCFKVASFTNDRPEAGFKRGFMVLFLKIVDPVLGIFGRVGMGQITDASLFEEQDESRTHERLVIV